MLWTIVAVLLVLWLLGFALNVVGSLIHVPAGDCPGRHPDASADRPQGLTSLAVGHQP